MAIYNGALHMPVRDAAKVAALWKSESSDSRGREVACQLFGTTFKVQIEGTQTAFLFCADGTVKTLNAKAHRSQPKHLSMDYSRPVVGFAKGRPIYA